MQIKMEGFRRRLLTIIIAVIIAGFVLVCFCFIHYNCMTEEHPKRERRERVKKYARSPSHRSSNTSLTENLIPSPNCERNKYSDDKLSQVSSQNKAFASSNVEMKIKILKSEKARAKLLGEPSKQEIPCKISRLKKGVRPSNSRRKSKGYHKGKSPRSHKIVSKVHSSYRSRVVKTPLPVTLETRHMRHMSSSSLHAHNQFVSATIQKLLRSSHRRRLSCTDKTHDFLMRPLAKSCHCHKDICLICKISELVVNSVFETKCRHRSCPKKRYFSRSFRGVESQEYVVHDNLNKTDEMTVATDDNDDDSDKEIIIFCKVDYSDDALKELHVK